MGFFQELKENLSQAVNELMPEEQELKQTETADTVSTEEIVTEDSEVSEAMLQTEDETETTKEISEEEELAQLEAEIEALEKEEAEEKEKVDSETENEIDQAIGSIQTNDSAIFHENFSFAAMSQESKEEETKIGEMAETEEIAEEVTETAIESAIVETTEGTVEVTETEEPTEVSDAEEVTEVEEPTEVSDAEEVTEAEETTEVEEFEMAVEGTVVSEGTKEVQESEHNGENAKEGATQAAQVWGERKMDTASRIEAADETAVITAGMTVNGDITSQGSLNVIGKIEGNVDIYGKLNITGTINGNSRASEIYADSARITGEVCSEGSVKIGQSSVIIGNITASSAVIAGAVKGDIDVKGPVILDTSAIVMGNIKSKSVQINNGAVIEGMCSQCYAEISPSSFFNDIKK